MIKIDFKNLTLLAWNKLLSKSLIITSFIFNLNLLFNVHRSVNDVSN